MYLVKNIVIFAHFITLAAPNLRRHNKLSVTTYMINNYRYRLVLNFTIVIGFFSCIAQALILSRETAKG